MSHKNIITGIYVKVQEDTREKLHLYNDGERLIPAEGISFGYGNTPEALNVARTVLHHFTGRADEQSAAHFHGDLVSKIPSYSSFSFHADEVRRWLAADTASKKDNQ